MKSEKLQFIKVVKAHSVEHGTSNINDAGFEFLIGFDFFKDDLSPCTFQSM